MLPVRYIGRWSCDDPGRPRTGSGPPAGTGDLYREQPQAYPAERPVRDLQRPEAHHGNAQSVRRNAIADLQIETLFLAASGLNDRGAFCANDFDALTKRALIEVSDNVVLLADSSKFSILAMVKICGWEAIGTLIIDDDLSADAEALLRDNNVNVIRVDARAPVAGLSEAGLVG